MGYLFSHLINHYIPSFLIWLLQGRLSILIIPTDLLPVRLLGISPNLDRLDLIFGRKQPLHSATCPPSSLLLTLYNYLAKLHSAPTDRIDFVLSERPPTPALFGFSDGFVVETAQNGVITLLWLSFPPSTAEVQSAVLPIAPDNLPSVLYPKRP